MTGYRLDRRGVDELVAALAHSARASQLPPWLRADDLDIRTWADLLFDGDRLGDPGEPSQALLAALAHAHAGLLEHLNALPARSREWYVAERLGIRRVPAQPDRVVVVPEADPKLPPAVVPEGAPLRAKDPTGGERRYATTSGLTVLGAGVLGVRSHHAEPCHDTVARHDGPVEGPFEPFAPAGAVAPHELIVASPLFGFEARAVDDGLWAHIEFQDVTQPGVLEGLRWTYSTADGGEAPAVEAAPVDLAEPEDGWSRVSLRLEGASCVPGVVGDGRDCFVRGAFPGDEEPGRHGEPFDRDDAYTLTFTAVRVWAQREREGEALPDAAAHNAGLLDIGQEFQPFGPVPQRGDAFYLRCDEAFGKPLVELTVHLDLLTGDPDEPPGVMYMPQSVYVDVHLLSDVAGHAKRTEGTRKGRSAGSAIRASVEGPAAPATKLVWARFDGRSWQAVKRSDALEETTMTWPGSHPLESRRTAVAGVEGHWMRVSLQNGDFGWSAYVRRLAELASAAAGGDDDPPSADDLVPPDPPIVSVASIAYRTRCLPPSAIRSRNGLHEVAVATDGAARPFRLHPFTEHGADAAGELILGLGLEPTRLGSTLAIFLGLESASVCTPWDPPQVTARWEYRAAGGWQPIDVLDGTRALRQSGIVRLVAPHDWADGAADLGEQRGRWLRAVLPAPAAAGTLVAVLPDAVEAREIVEPGADLPAREPLPEGSVSGLVTPTPGVKAVTNPLPSSGAPGTEPAGSLFTRSARVVAHRGRAVTAPGVEAHVRDTFAEVAVVRCLPHMSHESSQAPGWVTVVLIPDDPGRQPLPSVDLAERVAAELRRVATPHLRVAVRCPDYVQVRVDAAVQLRPGHAAAAVVPQLEQALERHLHPLGADAAFGRPLYRSDLVALLEAQPGVAHLDTLRLRLPEDDPDRVDVDPCLGLVASAGGHRLVATETL